MNWNEKQNHLTEQLEILRKLRKRFGAEVIEIASNARQTVHKKWMKDLSKCKSDRRISLGNHGQRFYHQSKNRRRFSG